MAEATAEPAAEEKQNPMYLTFALDEQVYGVPLDRVLEIIGMMPITPIPETPAHVKGVINLRGRVIPVVDARARFRLPARPYEARTCIIVVQTGGWSVGLVVDTVSDVAAIPPSALEEPPPITGAGDHYLASLGKVGDQVRLLLDVDRFLANVGA
jgi:purine-binding chemotaxis protein CheW